MKKARLYEYGKCSTCKKARKFLEGRKVAFEAIPIVDRPPTLAELRAMLGIYEGKVSKLFNTSGVQYRELKLSERLSRMTDAEALDLLRGNGKLVKRPFLLTNDAGRVGFDEGEWEKLFSASAT